MPFQSFEIQRLRLGTAMVVPTSNDSNRHAGKRLGDSRAIGHGLIETDEQNPDRTAMTFHHSIGRECGGHGDQ